jgi:hypothetical protein
MTCFAAGSWPLAFSRSTRRSNIIGEGVSGRPLVYVDVGMMPRHTWLGSPAGQESPIGWRRKRNGNMPPARGQVPASASAPTKQTFANTGNSPTSLRLFPGAAVAAARRAPMARLRSAASKLTHGVFSMSMATLGNGWRIAGNPILVRAPPTAPRCCDLEVAKWASFAVVPSHRDFKG